MYGRAHPSGRREPSRLFNFIKTKEKLVFDNLIKILDLLPVETFKKIYKAIDFEKYITEKPNEFIELFRKLTNIKLIKQEEIKAMSPTLFQF